MKKLIKMVIIMATLCASMAVGAMAMPYVTGDGTPINISDEQAIAFAELLLEVDYETPCAMSDGGNGVPVLWIDSEVWYWDGTKAVQQATIEPMKYGMYYTTYSDENVIYENPYDPAVTSVVAFECENGVINQEPIYQSEHSEYDNSGGVSYDKYGIDPRDSEVLLGHTINSAGVKYYGTWANAGGVANTLLLRATPSTTTASLTPAQAQAYLDAIDDTAEYFSEYGEYKLLGSKLIDMDNDGIFELCLIGSAFGNSTPTTFDVFCYNGSEAECIYSQLLTIKMGNGGTLYTYLIENDYGVQILSVESSADGGSGSSGYTSYQYENNSIYDVNGNEVFGVGERQINEYLFENNTLVSDSVTISVSNTDYANVMTSQAVREDVSDDYHMASGDLTMLSAFIEPYGLYYSNGEVLVKNEVINENYTGSCVADLEAMSTATETVTEIDTSPNLVLDFGKVNTLTGVDEFVAYIKSMLADLNGDEVNDASKSELVTFIENAITAPSTVTIGATNNVVNITADDIANGVRTATDALVTYEDLLESEGVELNKSITLIIRIIGNQLDVGEPMEVILNSDLADSLDAEVLQIYLGSSNHAIQISAENLKILVAEYGSISVQIQCNDDGNYTINFLDAEREIIDQMPASVTVFLPCDSEFYTVMARYGTQSDNWGGQFSAVDNTISFTTPYTGIYELLDNSQNIADISDLPADTQNAIKFMISKGFFTIDEDENYRPYESLLRQDATKALVSMFFTLDRSLTCDFPDVAIDSYYYSYVASAAADDIVLGYDDGTFGGGDAMTTEQLLAIVSRTLVEKKGYVYPTDMGTYLSSISGANSTSTWAQEAVALAIREGIILSGEAIDPTAPITRTDAALYLYRLFMLLEEVNPVAIDMDIFVEPSDEIVLEEVVEKKSGNLATAIIAGASATAIILGVGAVYIKKCK